MRQVALVCLALCLAGVLVDAQPKSTEIKAPVTVPYNQLLRPFSQPPPIGTYPNDPNGGPSQVHLSLAGYNSVTVMWATGQYKVGTGALTPNNASASPSVVKYSTDPANAMNVKTVNGSAETYNQIYNGSNPLNGGNTSLNYTSPVLHNAIISNLSPGTKYFYQVGDGQTFSAIFNFTSMTLPGPSYPQRIITLADWGISDNASSTLQHSLYSAANTPSPPVVFYIADYCYADTWYTNGTTSSTANSTSKGFEGLGSGTYQPIWDEWMNFLQPLISQVPFLGSTGNHEIEQQYDAANTIFASVQARWKYPSKASGGSFFFFSSEFGPVHSIFLSPYVDYTPGSDQFQWLAYDLQGINRTLTPWVIVNFHNPWYTTDSSYKEFEQMRTSMEPLTYKFGVDVFFYGHVHAYERTTPVYDYKVDFCGAVHITIGDAGNSEGLSFLADDGRSGAEKFEDLNGGCPNVTSSNQRISYITSINPANDPFAYYKHVLLFQADGNSTGVPGTNPMGYCYKEQPIWSAYREPSFGHGTLDVVNSTHALWSWHRNQDGNMTLSDQVYIIHDTVLCPNKAGASTGMYYNPKASSDVEF